jgi:quinol monooxygenase YgiN
VPSLAVHARFLAHPGRGDDLVAAVDEMFATAEQEPGTLIYAAHRDRDEPDAVVMYELYADDAALDDHGDSDAAKRFGDVLDGLLAEEPEVWFARPVRATGLPFEVAP